MSMNNPTGITHMSKVSSVTSTGTELGAGEWVVGRCKCMSATLRAKHWPKPSLKAAGQNSSMKALEATAHQVNMLIQSVTLGQGVLIRQAARSAIIVYSEVKGFSSSALAFFGG